MRECSVQRWQKIDTCGRWLMYLHMLSNCAAGRYVSVEPPRHVRRHAKDFATGPRKCSETAIKISVSDKPEHNFTGQFTISVQKQDHPPNNIKLPKKRKLTWVVCIHGGNLVTYRHGAGWMFRIDLRRVIGISIIIIPIVIARNNIPDMPPWAYDFVIYLGGNDTRRRHGRQPPCGCRHDWSGDNLHLQTLTRSLLSIGTTRRHHRKVLLWPDTQHLGGP